MKLAVASSAKLSVVGAPADAACVDNGDAVWDASAVETGVVALANATAVIPGAAAYDASAVDTRAVVGRCSARRVVERSKTGGIMVVIK